MQERCCWQWPHLSIGNYVEHAGTFPETVRGRAAQNTVDMLLVSGRPQHFERARKAPIHLRLIHAQEECNAVDGELSWVMLALVGVSEKMLTDSTNYTKAC